MSKKNQVPKAKKSEVENTVKDVEMEEVKPQIHTSSLTVKSVHPIYTYVGGGEDSPRVIEFMGLQKFVRGKATEVTNPKVLAKIAINPSFVEGEVDEEELHDYDQKAAQEAAEQKKKDLAIDMAFKKKHHGE